VGWVAAHSGLNLQLLDCHSGRVARIPVSENYRVNQTFGWLRSGTPERLLLTAFA